MCINLTFEKSTPIMPRRQAKRPLNHLLLVKKEIIMLKKQNRKYLIIAASVIFGVLFIIASVFSAAAAITNTNEAKQTKSDISYGELEFANGDILIGGKNNNGEYFMEILKAFYVTVNENGTAQRVKIARGTVADVLRKANITLKETQAVTPSLNHKVSEDTVINIENGYSVKITADGKTEKVVAPLGTVENALKSLDYNITKDDIISVDKDAEIKPDMKIKIQRVTYKQTTKTEKIYYDTVTKTSEDLEVGETKVETKGKNGVKEVTSKVKYIDGKKTNSKIVKEKVIKKPVKKVVLVGQDKSQTTYAPFEITSNGANTFTDSSGNTVAYSRVLTGSGTAYTAPAGSGTATGVTAYLGGVAVNPNIIPYGSRLYIVSTDGSFVYGYATAVDTGGALMEGSAIVDVFYPTYDECVNFGRRDVNVYVLS